MGRMAGIQLPAVEGNSSLLHSVQTDSGAHTFPYPSDIGGSFPWGKAAGK
jgi:hypothetical protein